MHAPVDHSCAGTMSASASGMHTSGSVHGSSALRLPVGCKLPAIKDSNADAGQSQAAPLRVLTDAETMEHLWSGLSSIQLGWNSICFYVLMISHHYHSLCNVGIDLSFDMGAVLR